MFTFMGQVTLHRKERTGKKMQLELTILGLTLACVAIWLGFRNKKNTDRRFKGVEGKLADIEKNTGSIRHIRRQLGGKYKKEKG